MSALLDTHCHLDAAEFDRDRNQVIAQAQAAGVSGVLIPAVEVKTLARVRSLAWQFEQGAYAVGIHPMFVRYASDSDLQALRDFVHAHLDDPRLVAIGEIGLDFFVPEISQGSQRARQIEFYRAQLELAHDCGLPVLLHVRRSQDELLKWLRRMPPIGGIAHAFNGSFQQAEQFIGLGFALGAGGAFTFTRAKQIRRLVTSLPLSDLVLETDAPDMAPAWLTSDARNTPDQVAAIAASLAELRGVELDVLLEQTKQAALRVIPRLQTIWT